MKYLLLLLVLISCNHVDPAISIESGVVLEKNYVADHSSTTINTDGKVYFTSSPAQYLVTFKCQHGVAFTINRNDLYASLDKGDTVQIEYHNIRNRKHEVTDFAFINAHKITSKQW